MNPAMLEFTQHPQTLAQGLVLLFALVIGHSIADYPLQGDFLAIHKNRHVKHPAHSRDFPPTLWIHCLLAHSLIHAGFVWIITGNVLFALMETVLHFIIDAVKCERLTSYHTDQFLHFGCKMLYVALIMTSGGSGSGVWERIQ
jgi:hypothetical protein